MSTFNPRDGRPSRATVREKALEELLRASRAKGYRMLIHNLRTGAHLSLAINKVRIHGPRTKDGGSHG